MAILYIYIIYGNNMVIDLHGGSSIFSGRHVAIWTASSECPSWTVTAWDKPAISTWFRASVQAACHLNIHIYIIYIYIIYMYMCDYIYMGRCYTSIIHGCVIYISNISNIYSFLFKQN